MSLFVLILGCSQNDTRNGAAPPPADSGISDEAAARAALTRYYDGFNSVDADTLTNALALPFVSAGFPLVQRFDTAAAYAQPLWDGLQPTGWERSAADVVDVATLWDGVAQLDVANSRLAGDGSVLSHSRFLYGVVSTSDGWRVASVTSVSTWQPDASEPIADSPVESRTAVDDYFAALNARDIDGLRQTLLFPFVNVVAPPGDFANDAASFQFDFTKLERSGWRESRVASARSVAATPTTVFYSVQATCHDDAGKEIGRHEGLYASVLSNGVWKIQMISPMGSLCEKN
jgi:hypothetical protein